VVDLTFARYRREFLLANVKSKTTPETNMFAGVPLVLTFVRELAATRVRMSEPERQYPLNLPIAISCGCDGYRSYGPHKKCGTRNHRRDKP
jgi:hypothetical protein